MNKMTEHIVTGQPVTPVKLERAKQLRHRMTPEEALLWKYLRTNQFSGLHFRRQQVIAGFIADFYCHACGLVIELDGGIHLGQAEYDAERTSVLEQHNLRVLRIANEDVHSKLEDVLTTIAAACGIVYPPSS